MPVTALHHHPDGVAIFGGDRSEAEAAARAVAPGLDVSGLRELEPAHTRSALVTHLRRLAPTSAVIDLTGMVGVGRHAHRSLFPDLPGGAVWAVRHAPGAVPWWLRAVTPGAPRSEEPIVTALRNAAAEVRDRDGIRTLTRSRALETAVGEGGPGVIDLGCIFPVLAVQTEGEVEVSNNGRTWAPLDAARDSGVHRPARPLFLRWLRVTAPAVVLGRIPQREDTVKPVIARRADGLGARLCAVVNAIRLAALLDAPFALGWNDALVDDPYHPVPPAERMFAADYLGAVHKNHLFPATLVAPATRGSLADTQRRLLEARALRTSGEPLPTVVTDPAAAGPFWPEFERIGFAGDLLEAVAGARRRSLPPEAVGVHVRSGDIVFGDYRRYFVHTRKVIPAAVAGAVVRALEAEGRTAVLFVDDDRALPLARTERTVLARDLLPATTDPTVAAFAEFALMATLDRVVARESAFAQLAAMLSGRPALNPDAVLPPSRQREITVALLDADAAGDPLTAAFSAWAAYYHERATLEAGQAEKLLDAAATRDPGNPLYPLEHAALLIRDGRPDEAEDRLADAATTVGFEALLDTTRLRTGGRSCLEETVSVLRTAGTPWAMKLSAQES